MYKEDRYTASLMIPNLFFMEKSFQQTQSISYASLNTVTEDVREAVLVFRLG